MKNIFITGSTGFLGKSLLAKLAFQSDYDRIFLLVRSNRRQTAQQRTEAMVRKMFPQGRFEAVMEKLEVIEGDLTQDNLGMNAEERGRVVRNVHQILHIGASTDFGAPIDVARKYNVEGTRKVLELAVQARKEGALERFDYVSTAFVAGTKPGLVSERHLTRRQKFANSYEQSKYEAELLVRTYLGQLDVTIYRPSIVVGDSVHGYTPHFKVLYWPLRLLSANVLPFIACNPFARLDVVPVNYVTDGLLACLTNKHLSGETIYLTAGSGGEVSIRQLLKDAYRIAKIRKVPILPFWVFNLIRYSFLNRYVSADAWEAAELARPYYCYLRGTKVEFDAEMSQAVLASMGVEAPCWDAYKKEVLAFCSQSKWGKKLPMPEYTYYLPVS